MNRKSLSALILSLILLLASVPVVAENKADLSTIDLSNLSKSQKVIIEITLDAAISSAERKGGPASGSSRELGIDYSDYDIDELKVLLQRVMDSKDIPSKPDIISRVENAVWKSFKDGLFADVSLHGENIIVRVLGDDNYTARAVRDGMLESIYNTMVQIHDLPLSYDFLISFPTIDKKGNESLEIVMKVTFTKGLVQEINWEKFLFINIPEVADRYFVFPVFDIK